MGDGVSINLGETLPYLETRLLQLIGKDQSTRDLEPNFGWKRADLPLPTDSNGMREQLTRHV